MSATDAEPRYTARQWDVLLHPGLTLIDVNMSQYMCTPLTREEYSRLYGASTVCPLYDWQRMLDLATIPTGTTVKIETLSQSLYTFVYRGTTDDEAHAIVDIVSALKPNTFTETGVVCDKHIAVGSRFTFGTTRTNLVVEFQFQGSPGSPRHTS